MGLFGGFKGAGAGSIGSSANTTNNTTENKNNATSGDNSAIFDSRGGVINVTDGGALMAALDFAGAVNQQAIQGLTTGTAAVLDKVSLDSGERVEKITQYGIIAVAVVAGAWMLKR